jgi:tetratricopeptide (TPR) repeat protein
MNTCSRRPSKSIPAINVLTLSVLLSVPSAAQSRKAVVAFAPPTSDNAELQHLGLLIEARASELIERKGTVLEFHLSEMLRLLGPANGSASALTAQQTEGLRLRAGVDRLLSFALIRQENQLQLSGFLSEDGKQRPLQLTLSAQWPKALEEASRALAKVLLKTPTLPGNTVVQPHSSNEEALRALGACYQVVIRQPLNADVPALLELDEMKRAASGCQTAMRLDPKLHFAHALEALAQAFLGSDETAIDAIKALSAADETLEPYTLAQFWLLTRYQSNEAGIAFLQAMTAKHPQELMLQFLLGDALHTERRFRDALVSWENVLQAMPRSPTAWGRLSRARASLGQHLAAVDAASKGLAFAPDDDHARLELGNRLIDAGRLDEAQSVLSIAAQKPNPPVESVLRLAWVHWLRGDLTVAADLFAQARNASAAGTAWRLRGRAWYGIALVEAKRGNTQAARNAFAASLATGFRVKSIERPLRDAIAEASKNIAMGQLPDAGADVDHSPEVSLFPFDAFGEAEIDGPKSPAPEGLILFRF